MSRTDFFRNGISGKVETNTKVKSRSDLAPEQDFDCPVCDGKLKRRYSSRYNRYFYGCSNWVETKCNGSIGCHPDGSPLGIPVDQEGKDWRKRAHEAFDVLWKDGAMSRPQAYMWMREYSGVEMGHIGEMNVEQCQALIEAVDEFDVDAFMDSRLLRRENRNRDVDDCFCYEYPKD